MTPAQEAESLRLRRVRRWLELGDTDQERELAVKALIAQARDRVNGLLGRALDLICKSREEAATITRLLELSGLRGGALPSPRRKERSEQGASVALSAGGGRRLLSRYAQQAPALPQHACPAIGVPSLTLSLTSAPDGHFPSRPLPGQADGAQGVLRKAARASRRRRAHGHGEEP